MITLLAMIQIEQFEKLYSSKLIVKADNITIPDGICFLFGSNGAGKSTFLKSLAGLCPFKGKIYIDDIDINKNLILQRKFVNYSEADPVFPEYIVGNTLVKLFHKTKGGSEDIIEDITKRMEMDYFINNKIGTYSSGMLKKLSILLAFIGEPKVILLDEPYTTLDKAAQDVLSCLIEEYSKKTSFIISSHQTVYLEMLNVNCRLEICENTMCFQGENNYAK